MLKTRITIKPIKYDPATGAAAAVQQWSNNEISAESQ
jgi:hypothetical protein